MHFGEIALINNVTRTLSVRASSKAKLLSLKREAFDRILGSIKQFLKGDYQGSTPAEEKADMATTLNMIDEQAEEHADQTPRAKDKEPASF